MTSTTTRGKKPTDHQSPQGTAAKARQDAAERDELLAGMPELKPAVALRIGERNALDEILLDASTSGLFEGAGDDTFELDPSNPDDVKTIKTMNRLCEAIDLWAESIAVDKVAYAEWAGGKKHDTYFAILNHYQEATGESTGS